MAWIFSALSSLATTDDWWCITAADDGNSADDNFNSWAFRRNDDALLLPFVVDPPISISAGSDVVFDGSDMEMEVCIFLMYYIYSYYKIVFGFQWVLKMYFNLKAKKDIHKIVFLI